MSKDGCGGGEGGYSKGISESECERREKLAKIEICEELAEIFNKESERYAAFIKGSLDKIAMTAYAQQKAAAMLCEQKVGELKNEIS